VCFLHFIRTQKQTELKQKMLSDLSKISAFKESSLIKYQTKGHGAKILKEFVVGFIFNVH